jgi:hypothetical protein
LPPSDARDHDARVRLDRLKPFPGIVNHKENMICKTPRGNLDRESTGAVRIHRIRARYAHRDYVAVLAHRSSGGSSAVPIEGLRTDNGEQAGQSRRGSDEPGACECERALQSRVGAFPVACLRLGAIPRANAAATVIAKALRLWCIS